jgi:hypothetical protein|uniref:Uncharacterized protein n=1 Tax=viral metagenome TaxID=1070528 RepID=A0A6C0IQV1_9ZZZZ
MKFAIFTLISLTLVISANAGAYQNGFITGMVVEKISPRKKAEFHRYNTMIIDTSLFDFPLQKNPVCRPIQVKIAKNIRVPFGVRIIFILITILCVQRGIKDPEFGEFMVGYILGMFIESIMGDNDN